jgi:hypothetical protein
MFFLFFRILFAMDYVDSSDDNVLKSLLFDDSDDESHNNNNTHYNQLLCQSNIFQKLPRPTYIVRDQLNCLSHVGQLEK